MFTLGRYCRTRPFREISNLSPNNIIYLRIKNLAKVRTELFNKKLWIVQTNNIGEVQRIAHSMKRIIFKYKFGKVEIRVVIHKQTYERLPALAEFITRNLLFVDHVALMGLEMMGFTRANLDSLWVDPIIYKDQLSDAVNIFRSYGMVVSVYNHQLCLVNKDVEPVYIKSISDWKNEFLPECNNCNRINDCGGFFSSGIRHKYSESIKPFQN